MRDLHITVYLEDLFRRGRFDFLALGQTQEHILANFPDPDAWGPTFRDAANAVWRYGNMELHFREHVLSAIFSDYLDTLNGGPNVTIEPWILGEQPLRVLGPMMLALTGEGLDFEKRTNTIGQTELRLASGVRLTFDGDTPVVERRLIAIDLSAR